MQSDNKIEKHAECNPTQENRINDLSRAHWLPQGLFRAIGPITLGVVVVGGTVGYYAHQYVTRDSVRLPFWVGFMFSFLAFVVLLVQSVIYAQQAEFMKDQSKAMRDSVDRTDKMIENMQGQLTSMVNQESAMQGQLEAMRAQIERFDIAERAYVGIKEIALSPVEVGEPLTIIIVFQNGGRTPAWDVRCTANLLLIPAGLMRKPFGLSPMGTFFLPAGFDKQMRLVFEFTPTVEDVENIRSAELIMILYGKVDYKDFKREQRPPYMFSANYNPGTRKFQQRDDYNKEEST